MNFLDINHKKNKEIYLDFLNELIKLLCDYREKIIKEIKDDELC